MLAIKSFDRICSHTSSYRQTTAGVGHRETTSLLAPTPCDALLSRENPAFKQTLLTAPEWPERHDLLTNLFLVNSPGAELTPG